MQQDPLKIVQEGSGELQVILVAAHPDDEVIGCGSRLARLGKLTIVHVTDGAPENMSDASRHGFRTREEYTSARRTEFNEALRLAGACPVTTELGVPDQKACREVGRIAAKLSDILRMTRPALILTHPYEGGHPDHDACALAVHLAAAATPIVEFASYHNDGGQIRTGQFLPGGGSVLTIALSAEEQSRKRAMLQCFRTQAETLAAFGVETERFRLAPAYDFTRPPHEGSLYYEGFDWGMTGELFRALAREVLLAC